MSDRENIIKGIAKVLWALSWADHADECKCYKLSGVEIFDVMPPVPDCADTSARKIARAFEKAGETSLTALFEKVVAGGYKGDELDFGHNLAHIALGTGGGDLDRRLVPRVYCEDEGDRMREFADTNCEICLAFDVEVTDYGSCHAQYFQGHGNCLTTYEHCALGAGDTYGAALEDAIQQAVSNDPDLDVPAMRRGIRAHTGQADPNTDSGWFEGDNAHADCDPEDDENCELTYYVGLRW